MVMIVTLKRKAKQPEFLVPPRDYHADEAIAAAECLLLLSRSGDDSWKRTSTSSAPVQVRKQKVHPSVAPLLAPPQNKVYVCGVCGEGFRSHQALGGHQTTHRTKPQTKIPLPISAVDQVSGRMMTRRHECYICKEVFSSGQSLGVHIRKHYDGDLTKTKSTVSSDGSGNRRGAKSEGTTRSSGGGTGLVVDLNLMPPADDMEIDSALPAYI